MGLVSTPMINNVYGVLHSVVILNGIIDEYAETGKTVEALYVYWMMMQSIVLLMLTLTVIIKALAADPHSNFHGIAKEFVMEKTGKGMQPNSSTYIAVLEAFAGKEKMEEARHFLEEMEQ